MHGAVRAVFEAGGFGVGAGALVPAGHAVPALVLALVVAASKGLAVASHQ